MLITLTKDILNEFDVFNEKAKVSENRLELMNQFCELLELHSNGKQLSEN